jgi:hypothetical protein
MNQSSYGETSGFVSVPGADLEKVNGGNIITIPPWLIPYIIATQSKGRK